VDDEALMLSAGLQRRGRTQLWSMLDAGGYATAGRIDSLLRQAGLAPREIRVREPSLQNLFTLVADWRRAA
jgi:ABC-2 type transport system ATP-binding protein